MGKRCSIARAVFDAARKHRLIETNVFKDANIGVVVRGNRSRQAFIKRDDIDRVIKACPDAEWQLLVGLARFGGLRIPSEGLSLKWEHINWDQNITKATRAALSRFSPNSGYFCKKRLSKLLTGQNGSLAGTAAKP